MPSNIEIKARIKSVEPLKQVAASLSGSDPVEILQDDTFFTCEAGRLKLRAFTDGTGVLIFYQRADEKDPKESFFTTAPTLAPDALRDTLSLAYGQSGRVKKHRTLFTAGRTRIHLDRVDGLGDYLELEVMLADGEAAESGHQEAYAVMASLGVQHSQLVASAYVDLLTDKVANQ
ncbi:class IV adenylate cyclase [Rhodoferax sp. AJA081-3]|uniref:class IV adenylate cyclase n=1 Tax=Rhodoferax sp. AJA081-3 TaxID=2752316 RepID=UPI001ADFBD56|nr:class IV adenylate cyclase [Rhodoferax sp. AJA081-3]QTN30476.1 class IV adenylate cyclase [Rhodoferax sp. AJA081-3]